jgi:LPPG:FO 2-phospho-L-lactate transferase
VVVVLAGGVGGAKLLRGLAAHVAGPELVAVVNPGDDFVLHGLSISPDLDTVVYTLAGMADPERGWGLAGETWRVMEALERLRGETWFRLGDGDLATHLYRTGRLRSGATLSEVTAEIAQRLGVATRVLPMSDQPVRTIVELADGTEVAFQDYFVRMRHEPAVRSVRYEGAERARPAPGVLEALEAADRIVVATSNPVLSIRPILAVPGIEAALRARRDRVVAVSPIVAGRALRGPADRLLADLGYEPSALGVARLYDGLLGTFVLDVADQALANSIAALGMHPVVARTVMQRREDAERLAALVVGTTP